MCSMGVQVLRVHSLTLAFCHTLAAPGWFSGQNLGEVLPVPVCTSLFPRLKTNPQHSERFLPAPCDSDFTN